ncbi:hypothetical protein C8A03DRAFT_35198 [Achaetomium macrosporum]|uniref:Uncharacterized protein n=1 Tax=Achaetomium macrosporum TaxID=79813 RepID=A0AAN7HD17_9PEZI|nr:hypothetical protein C8A03DRAFT_35198 [Achaetomium macrosporum]
MDAQLGFFPFTVTIVSPTVTATATASASTTVSAAADIAYYDMVAHWVEVALAVMAVLWTIFTFLYQDGRRRKEQAQHKEELKTARRDAADAAAHKAAVT